MARNKRKQLTYEHIILTDAGAKGKAVGKTEDGRVLFVKNAVPGDVVDVRIRKKRRNYLEGEATQVHSYSDKRTEPKCEHFGTCGGCSWQNMDYKYQLQFKENEVLNNLKRIGHIELPETSPILGSDDIYYYRNKMEYSFSDNRWITQEEVDAGKEIESRNGLGFHMPGMWDKVLDIDTCHLQAEPGNSIRLALKAIAEKHNIPFFNLREQTGMLRTVIIRNTSIWGLMVLVQFREYDKKVIETLLDELYEQFPQITSLLYTINGKGNDTIYDLDIITYKGADHIFEEMEGLRFKIGPKSFYQTNSKQAYELYKITREYAALNENDVVYDLYTGTGTIAQFVAKKVKKVVGIESVPEAIESAKENAINNNIDNTVFYAGDMKKVLNDEFIAENGTPDVIITDPPRDGMHKDVVETILRVAPKRIVYVSCNSATQARDLALMDETYKVIKVQPVDMFPQTHHVENIVLLEKK